MLIQYDLYQDTKNKKHYLKKVKEYDIYAWKCDKPDFINSFCLNELEFNELAEERLYMLALNTALYPIALFELSKGSVNATIFSIRSILIRLLLCGAVKFVLVHNHPSLDETPSQEDINMFKKVKEASKLIEIDLLDNIIIGEKYFSFYENEIY